MRFLFPTYMFLIFLSFTIVLFYNIQFLTLISVFSQNDDKKGFGIQERERTRTHAGNDSQIVNDDKSGIQERERLEPMLGMILKLLMMINLEYKKENVLEHMQRTNLNFLAMI